MYNTASLKSVSSPELRNFPLAGRVEWKLVLAFSGAVLAFGVAAHILGGFLDLSVIRIVAFILYAFAFNLVLAIPGQWAYDQERGDLPFDAPGEPLIQQAWQQCFCWGIGVCIGSIVLGYVVRWEFLLGVLLGAWQITGAITDMRWYLKRHGVPGFNY